MNIELGTLTDGNIIMVSDQPLPDMVKRIEYYREQHLLNLVYDGDDHHDELMEYEVPSDMQQSVVHAPNITVYSLFADHEPIGYKVPLVQVGNIY